MGYTEKSILADIDTMEWLAQWVRANYTEED